MIIIRNIQNDSILDVISFWEQCINTLYSYTYSYFNSNPVSQVFFFHLPVSKWWYEVEATMHPVVHYVSSVQPALVVQVPFKLIVNVLDDGLEADMREGEKVSEGVSDETGEREL